MVVLEGVNIYKSFPVRKNFFGKVVEKKEVLKGVSVKIEKGETVAVIGESGCGKSTLGKILLDIEKPDDGKVLYKGKDIADLSKSNYREYRVNVQAVFQNPYNSLNPRMKVVDIVSEGLKINFSFTKAELKEKVEEAIALVGLSPGVLELYPHQLSGGQRQRVAIARAVVMKPEIIIADEPTSALDVSVQSQIINLFLDIQERFGIGYFFISHSLGVVDVVADTVFLLKNGINYEIGKENLMEFCSDMETLLDE